MSFNDPNSGLNRGKIIRIDDLNPEVTAKLPSGSFPIHNADIADVSATKLLGGAANQFIRWIAGAAAWVTLLAADIIAILGFTPENVANKDAVNGYAGLDAAGKLKASEAGNASGIATLDASGNLVGNIEGKAIDTATVPADGQALTFNAASNKWKPAATGGLPAGADGNVIQYVGAVPTAQDLKIGTKPVDNTVVPTDGMFLTYDNTSGKVKFIAMPSKFMSEVVFLQGQAALGKLITAQAAANNPAGSAVITSYTPANGTTFVLYEASGSFLNGAAGGAQTELRLRNNTAVKATQMASFSLVAEEYFKYPVKGDQLVGTGALVYDIIVTTAPASATGWIAANLMGYLL